MILQKASFYALRIMIHMAESIEKINGNGSTNHNPNPPFFSYNLAKACGIPPHYLCKVLSKLVHAGVLTAHPGKKGGYSFRKNPDNLTLYEIVEPFENFTNYSNCFCGEHYCLLYGKNLQSNVCPLHPIIKDNIIQIFSKFKSITLQNLINNSNSNHS